MYSTCTRTVHVVTYTYTQFVHQTYVLYSTTVWYFIPPRPAPAPADMGLKASKAKKEGWRPRRDRQLHARVLEFVARTRDREREASRDSG